MQSRRARKSYDQWAVLVAEFDSSNFSMEEFCQRKDLAMSTFQRWRSTIHRADSMKVNDSTSRFTEIASAPTTPPVPSSTVTLQIGHSVTVTIHTTESI